MADKTKQRQDKHAQVAGANGAPPHASNGHAENSSQANGSLHPSSMTARKLRAMNAALRESEGARDRFEEEDDVPDVGAARIGTISEAAERLRAAGVIPPVQPMAHPGEDIRRGPAVPGKRLRPIHRRKSFWGTLMAIILLLGLPFAWFYFQPYIDPLTGQQKGIRGDNFHNIPRMFVDPQKALISAFGGNPEVHFLLVGLDHVPPSKRDPNPIHRSDSIILVTTNLENKEVRMLSIPRDGWVMHIGSEGEELGWDKLAHTYANGTEDNPDNPIGGIRRTKMTVENLMGITVDNYLIIEIDGFQKIIDELGGITIDVEKRMKYRDRAGGLNIDLQPGEQVLTGEQAMGYARFRHDAVGDIGRMGRQQKVIKAIINEMQKPANLTKLPSIAALFNSAVKTDMRTDQLLALINQSKKFELSKIQSQTLPSYWNREPGHRIDLPGADGGMDAQYINPAEVDQFRQFLLALEPPPLPTEGAETLTEAQFMGGSDLENRDQENTDGTEEGESGEEETPLDPNGVRNPCAKL